MKTKVTRPEPPKKVPPFTEITLTFDREEATLLAIIMGSITGCGRGRQLTDKIYDAIANEIHSESEQFLGEMEKAKKTRREMEKNEMAFLWDGMGKF